MKQPTTGNWTVALGAATASGTWEGFRLCPVRHTAELHVDGALTIGEGPADASDYALVLSHPSLGRDRVLVAGKGGTIEFGHDVVELLNGAANRNVIGDLNTDVSGDLNGEATAMPQSGGAQRPRGESARESISIGMSDKTTGKPALASIWLADLTTGATSERCPLPQLSRPAAAPRRVRNETEYEEHRR